IDVLGPERVYEGFGSTEAIGAVNIRGDEWLDHPGSIGRPQTSDVRVVDEYRRVCAAGEVGEIWMRWRQAATASAAGTLLGGGHEYWGSAPAPHDADGYSSVGDLGWFDAEGYLYVADRRTDMVISGGVNVYPAEVESALSEHPDVFDVVVVGLPDPEWGRRVHAVVATNRRHDLIAELGEWCRSRLAPAKRPKSDTLTSQLQRTEAGKVRRTQVAAEVAKLIQPPPSAASA